MSGLDVERLRERLTTYEDEWLWHEQTDELLAGYGHHMGQMLYRLPKDGQTRDMKASVEAMLADLAALLDHIAGEQARVDAAVEARLAKVLAELDYAEAHGRHVANDENLVETGVIRAALRDATHTGAPKVAGESTCRRHGNPDGRCPSCAACAACDGSCGVCPYDPAPEARQGPCWRAECREDCYYPDACVEDKCSHDWTLRPESDTWFCEMCGAER